MRTRWLIGFTIAALVACNSDAGKNNKNDADPEPDLAGDMGRSDDVSGSDDAENDAPDASTSDCVQVTANLDTFTVSYADDVSIEYSVRLVPAIDGQDRDLSLLFERYVESEFVGTFELGTGSDDNFGTCSHCVFVRGDSPERAYFADAGTLESAADPFGRRVEFGLAGLRLIEVGVDPFTRESAPLQDGRCIEVADFEQSGTYPVVGWTCPAEQFADGTACNCECGAHDPDCDSLSCLPDDPGCTPQPRLPVEGCSAGEICTFEPITMLDACTETCDWAARDGCSSGTCVYEFGVGDGDVCIGDGPRIAAEVTLGGECPQNGLQVFCNVVGGFAEGYCGPDYVCRPLCTDDAECPVEGETCHTFSFLSPLGYCGPEPVDM